MSGNTPTAGSKAMNNSMNQVQTFAMHDQGGYYSAPPQYYTNYDTDSRGGDSNFNTTGQEDLRNRGMLDDYQTYQQSNMSNMDMNYQKNQSSSQGAYSSSSQGYPETYSNESYGATDYSNSTMMRGASSNSYGRDNFNNSYDNSWNSMEGGGYGHFDNSFSHPPPGNSSSYNSSHSSSYDESPNAGFKRRMIDNSQSEYMGGGGPAFHPSANGFDNSAMLPSHSFDHPPPPPLPRPRRGAYDQYQYGRGNHNNCRRGVGDRRYNRGNGYRSNFNFNPRPQTIQDHTIQLSASNFNTWGFLRKSFNKSDNDLAEHLFEIHEKFCHRCKDRYADRYPVKKRKFNAEASTENPDAESETPEEELTEEEKEMKKLMGFAGFKSTKGAKLKDNNYSTAVSTDRSEDKDAGDKTSTLTESEKKMIASLGGFSVFSGGSQSKVPFGAPAVTMQDLATSETAA